MLRGGDMGVEVLTAEGVQAISISIRDYIDFVNEYLETLDREATMPCGSGKGKKGGKKGRKKK